MTFVLYLVVGGAPGKMAEDEKCYAGVLLEELPAPWFDGGISDYTKVSSQLIF